VKVRADELLVQRGLAPTRSKARALIMAGQVRIGDRVIDKAGTRLERSDAIEVEQGPRFVSRGGEKLQHALATFGVDPADWVCADFGASTGGFTDGLIQAGARRVYAIDVGYGQLDYRLRTDSRVVVMERVNARHLNELPEPVDLVTIDVSFISLRLMFPSVKRVLKPEAGHCIALVKPQFEAGRAQVGKGGVVRDPSTHATVLHSVTGYAADNDLHVVDLTRSPIAGPSGNREFLMLLGQTRPQDVDPREKIEQITRSSPDSER
jgi:23S rRNA (cytidine1920-2'-O)/16S rRNA (cytidine1409-2'-O)-methyltransferase